ncbi:MAG TPA: lysophospholipid acyltransferase family protein [Dehalococcoidia bacterium]|nr:lysophospholipid acyltransferase family protein [Dehalococcoidia bacterium]
MTEENQGQNRAPWWLSRPACLLRSVFFHLVLVRLVRRYARPLRIHGIENLERLAGPVIFAAHHESHSDTAIVLAALPERFRERLIIAAAADVLFTNPVSGALASLFLGAVPIERKASALSTLREVADLMAKGSSLLIYPLGKCSADGSVGEFKPGVGLLARLSNTPVVLVGIEGSRDALPLAKRWPLRAAVTVRFAAPMTYAHPSAEAFAEDLQLEMARLLTARSLPRGQDT